MGKKIMNNGVTKAFTHCLPQFLLRVKVLQRDVSETVTLSAKLSNQDLNCGINPAKSSRIVERGNVGSLLALPLLH